MLNLSKRTQTHIQRLALGIGTAVIIFTMFAILPWYILKYILLALLFVVMYVLGYIMLELFNDFREILKYEEENQIKKDKQ